MNDPDQPVRNPMDDFINHPLGCMFSGCLILVVGIALLMLAIKWIWFGGM